MKLNLYIAFLILTCFVAMNYAVGTDCAANCGTVKYCKDSGTANVAGTCTECPADKKAIADAKAPLADAATGCDDCPVGNTKRALFGSACAVT